MMILSRNELCSNSGVSLDCSKEAIVSYWLCLQMLYLEGQEKEIARSVDVHRLMAKVWTEWLDNWKEQCLRKRNKI